MDSSHPHPLIAYFDCSSGIAGNMILGALLSAGLDEKKWRRGLATLAKGLPGSGLPVRIVVSSVRRGPIQATHVDVRAPRAQRERRLVEITRIIRKSGLAREVVSSSVAVFERLARAEAAVHGVSKDSIHFHELGAYDCIIDIVGAILGLHQLGVTAVFASPVNLGTGTVSFSHGTFSVPAPATAELLKGVPVYAPTATSGELTTPTGAAILTQLARDFGPMPAMRLLAAGLGAGSRRTGVLRVYLGRMEDTADKGGNSGMRSADKVVAIETNLDDMNPEQLGFAMERLFAAGALDVYFTPIYMKKNRPGVLLAAIAPPEARTELARIILTETTSLGVRYRELDRTCLARSSARVRTRFGSIRVKTGKLDGQVVTKAPEYESCRAAARRCGVPLKQVYAEAMRGRLRRKP